MKNASSQCLFVFEKCAESYPLLGQAPVSPLRASLSRNVCTDLGKQSILQTVSIVTHQSTSHLIPLLTDPLILAGVWICGRLFYGEIRFGRTYEDGDRV